MAQISVVINGRQFRISCDDGQEENLETLAKNLDSRINDLRAKFGEIGDTRLTVMAAIQIGDDLADAKQQIRRLQDDLRQLHDARALAADRAHAAQDAVIAAFNSAAERLEGITKRLNETLSDGVAIG
ncbi:MAG TPA: cell division protein ZapA [Pseudolabrys sp.]|nr:cell division protein ZapA [Pseudolabrys sp.]